MDYLGGYAERGLVAERIVKAALLALAAAALLGAIYYVFFRNWREELQARRFFGLLQEQEYENAYSLWGCSVAEPCRYYPFEEFLEDWGPEAPYGSLDSFSIGRSFTLATGVRLRYSINGREGPPLWIDRDPYRISFAPD